VEAKEKSVAEMRVDSKALFDAGKRLFVGFA
jgi:hypothetical protein